MTPWTALPVVALQPAPPGQPASASLVTWPANSAGAAPWLSRGQPLPARFFLQASSELAASVSWQEPEHGGDRPSPTLFLFFS